VNIPYEDKFFRKDITLFIYRLVIASTGEVWQNGYFRDLDLDPEIPTLATRFEIDVDFAPFRNAIQTLDSEYVNSLKSLKHKDREMKIATRAYTSLLKGELGDYILSKVKPTMGPNFEGVVMTVNNVEYKITTDYFRELMLFKGMLGG
jgi:hypothetical protein